MAQITAEISELCNVRFPPIRDIGGRREHANMRLSSITANRHVIDGKVDPQPLRLLLAFDEGPDLRLQVAGDGERMIIGGGPLDEPFDMEEFGQVDVSDVTQSLFPQLSGFEVAVVEALALNGRQVGVKLNAVDHAPFHFWVDGDQLHWGDEAALVGHNWLDGAAPSASERIQI